jgi:hypothetical protein
MPASGARVAAVPSATPQTVGPKGLFAVAVPSLFAPRRRRVGGRNRMLTFRIAITAAVMAFVTAITACLIFIQIATFHAAARAAASAAMDAASANTLSRLEANVAELSTLVRVLSASPFLSDSDERSEADRAVALFKAALRELPQADSLYVGYDNGCWLQVRRLDVLDERERELLGAPPKAVYDVNLVRQTSGGALAMRRVFEDAQGKKLKQLDLPDYGYDARKRAGIATRCKRTGRNRKGGGRGIPFRHRMPHSASAPR